MEPSYFALWAKSSENSDVGHPVVAHLLDVAASAWAVLQLEPPQTTTLLAQDWELTPDEVVPLVCALAGLHDLGKVSPAFQQLWEPGKQRLWQMNPQYRWAFAPRYPDYVPHNHITQATLPPLLKAKGWNHSLLVLSGGVADALGCHHGFRVDEAMLAIAKQNAEKGTGIWEAARAAMVDEVLRVVGVRVAPSIQRLSVGGFMRLAGLTSFADWIGSSLYPKLSYNSQQTLADYYLAAQQAAVNCLAELGWTKRLPLYKSASEPNYSDVFEYIALVNQTFQARTLQLEVQQTLKQIDRPTLLIIEAAMGEGKTEAALYAFLRLQTELGHRGLYFALPTMATGNVMFKRVARFLEAQGKQQNREVPLDLQLLHGGALLNNLYNRLQGKNITSQSNDAQIAANTAHEQQNFEFVKAHSYFTQRRRALLSEYGVGTVDQALLTTLNVSHQFVRLWGLGNRVVIVDEVHAYDTYTSELIVTLVRLLREMGSSVILMSATLPVATRQNLVAAFGATNPLPQMPYPRITKVSAQNAEVKTFEPDASRKQQVRLEAIGDDLAEIVSLVLKQTANGGCAVCIVNTVDRAQALYQAFAHSNIERHLFHARFTAQDRTAIETKVNCLFGKPSPECKTQVRPHRAVLVATQVVEQSLDLDFDLMISDLAPTDLLLQRAGRLWRHQRPNRPLSEPVLYVAGLRHTQELPDLTTHYWDKVYDPYILYKSWGLIKDLTHITLPNDIDGLVQSTYDQALLGLPLSQCAQTLIAKQKDAFENEVRVHLLTAQKATAVKRKSDGSLALDKAVNLRDEDDPHNGQPAALTRLGSPSVRVVLLYQHDQKFFYDRAGTDPYIPKQREKTAMHTVSLSRVGVIGDPSRHIASPLEAYNHQRGFHQLFANWAKDPLLSLCVPLVLDANGQLNLSKVTVRYDPELGVVYQKPN